MALGAGTRIALVSFACAALAACGAASSDSGAAVATSALPHPKPGLWLWASGATGVKRLCLSGQVLGVLEARPGCPVIRQVVTREGVYIVESRCAGGAVSRIYAKAYGDYDRDFSTDVVVADVSDHAEYRYLGPCPPGQSPDDAP